MRIELTNNGVRVGDLFDTDVHLHRLLPHLYYVQSVGK
jgi:hypothetical protein